MPIFSDLINTFILTIRRPPADRSLIIILLFKRSGPKFHKNLKNNISNILISSPGGFGRAKNRWINLLKANDLITVILPSSDNLRLDHCCNKLCTLLMISGIFTSHMSNTSVVKVTPKILKYHSDQSRL